MFTSSVTDRSYLYHGLSVDLKRTYRPSYTSNGSLGRNWAFSYDTRMIRGYDAGYAEYARELRGLASDTLRLWNTAHADHTTATAQMNAALRATEAAITSAQQLVGVANAALRTARQITNPSTQSVKVAEAERSVGVATRLLNEARAEQRKVLTARAQLNALAARIQQIRRTYERLNRAALQAEQEQVHGDIQVDLNRRAGFSGDPAYLAETGLGTITLVDESGAPQLYHLDTSPDYTSTATYRNSKANYYPSGSTLTPLIPTGERLTLLSDGRITRTLKDQTVYTYSLYGILQSIRDRNGNTIRLDYERDRLTRITDGAGRTVALAWNTAGKPDGAYQRFHWQRIAGAWRCVRVDDDVGNPETFAYTHNGRAC